MEGNSTTAAPGGSQQPSANELAQERTDLAAERNRMAQERTMMAWIRTSTSMISFGFGIYKFFDYFHGPQPATQGIISPRRFAIFIIGTGLFVLAGASIQNWSENRRLRKIRHVPISLATVVAALISLLGILALIAVILRQ
jgi:inner membrane protein YidH